MCTCADAMTLLPNTSLFLIPIDRKLHILADDAPRLPGLEEVVEDVEEVSPSEFTPQDEGGNNNILAYVSVLAAVVLGLLIYVAYKW